MLGNRVLHRAEEKPSQELSKSAGISSSSGRIKYLTPKENKVETV